MADASTKMNNKNRNSIYLAPDDLEVGMYVSVERIRPQKGDFKTLTGPDGTKMKVQEHQDPKADAGIPRKILGISWPNIVLSTIYPGGLEDGPLLLRIPEIKLMLLDDSYVEAICSFENTKRKADEEATQSQLPFNHETMNSCGNGGKEE